MGRGTRYRDRVQFETGSVEAKALGGMLIRELREDFGLSRLEAEVLATRSVHWLEKMVQGVLPGQVLISVPATACMRLIRRRRMVVKVTAVDVSADGAVWREFGLETMQRARAVRLLHEIRRQGGWANLAEIAALLDLTPNTMTQRLRPLREAGIWLPHLRSERATEGQLPLEAYLCERLVMGGSTERIRKLIGLTVARLEAVMRDVVTIWQAYKHGKKAAVIAEDLGRTAQEVTAILGVVRRYRRRNSWKDWEGAYRQRGEAEVDGGEVVEEPFVVLQQEHGMSAVAARLFVGRLRELAARLGQRTSRRQGETIFFAISAEEGARTQLNEAKLVPVRLTYFTEEDLALGPRGTQPSRVRDLKFARILRYTTQARSQGALLTLPDLAMLLGIHVDAIRRLIAAQPQVVVPTRGRIKDIGRGVTHRRQIVELYLQMHTETEIVERTGHSYESVEAYLREFARVVTLADRGLNTVMIRRVTGRSMSLVEAYLDLYRKYQCSEYLFRLAQLRQVFARDEVLAGDTKKNGSPPTPGTRR